MPTRQVAINELLSLFSEEMEKIIKTKIQKEKHNDHTNEDEWYACVDCMDTSGCEDLRAEQRQKLKEIVGSLKD